MKTYKLKSSAVRAAKKEMGDDWAQFAIIVDMGLGEFAIELKPTPKAPSPELAKSIQLAAVLADQEEAEKEKAIKKAEIESRKPVHIPSLPASILVAKESAPAPKPSLPSFLKIAPPALHPVPDFIQEVIAGEELASPPEEVIVDMSAGDKAANEAVLKDKHFEVMNTTICPDCGGEELYTGEINESTGALQFEDSIIGCHSCDWHVDLRSSAPAKTPRPRLSTAELPTKKVWHIADEMLAAAKAAGLPAPKRKDVIAECVARGIAYGTSRTQYQHWFKTLNDSAATPIATIGADGKISMPGK